MHPKLSGIWILSRLQGRFVTQLLWLRLPERLMALNLRPKVSTFIKLKPSYLSLMFFHSPFLCPYFFWLFCPEHKSKWNPMSRIFFKSFEKGSCVLQAEWQRLLKDFRVKIHLMKLWRGIVRKAETLLRNFVNKQCDWKFNYCHFQTDMFSQDWRTLKIRKCYIIVFSYRLKLLTTKSVSVYFREDNCKVNSYLEWSQLVC